MRSLTKSVAMHCQQKGYGIRCNSVHPASIETPMIQGAMGRPGEEQEVPEGVLPAGAIGAPRDVANLDPLSRVRRIALRDRRGNPHRQRPDRHPGWIKNSHACLFFG